VYANYLRRVNRPHHPELPIKLTNLMELAARESTWCYWFHDLDPDQVETLRTEGIVVENQSHLNGGEPQYKLSWGWTEDFSGVGG